MFVDILPMDKYWEDYNAVYFSGMQLLLHPQ